jgi:hypothetical protein
MKWIYKRYSKLIVIVTLTIILAGSLLPRILKDTGQNNLSAHQAQAFLEGRLDVPKWVSEQLVDLALFDGHYYVVQSPFASVLLLPFVAVLGIENTKPMLIAIALTFLNVYLLALILKKIGTRKEHVPWLVIAYFLGTGYWSVLRGSTYVWFFAQIVGTTGLLLALNEAFGRARGAIIGLFLGMAVLSRQNAIFYLILIGAVLWQRYCPAGDKKKEEINIAGSLSQVVQLFTNYQIWGLLAVLGLWIGLYLYLNWLRFGNPFDPGYEYLINNPQILEPRAVRYGLFNVAYIPFNFTYMFIQGFQIRFDPNTSYLRVMDMDPFGTSLTFASPFLFIAFWAKWERNMLRAAWVSIALILGMLLAYFSNGWVQPNAQRYSLDFIPILILLVALGMQRVNARIWKVAIAYSVILNVLALFVIPLIVRISR